MGEQRTDDDLGAFVERLLGGLLGALRGAGVVLDQELDVRIVELGERELGRIAHRLAGEARIAAGRERQHQPDLTCPVPIALRAVCSDGGGGELGGKEIAVRDAGARAGRQQGRQAPPPCRP